MRQWLHEIGIIVVVVVVLSSARMMLGTSVEPIQRERHQVEASRTVVVSGDELEDSRKGQLNDWWREPISINSEYTSESIRYRASKLDLNRATLDELKLLKGIGDVLAKRIIDDREANGYYSDAEDLMRVKGIANKKLDGFRNDISP